MSKGEPGPLDGLYDSILDLLDLAEECQEKELKTDDPAVAIEQIEELQKKTEELRRASQEILKAQGFKDETPLQVLDKTPNVKKSTHRLMERLEKLERRVEKSRDQWKARTKMRAIGEVKADKGATEKERTQKASRKRKKKFDRLGKDGWMKM